MYLKMKSQICIIKLIIKNQLMIIKMIKIKKQIKKFNLKMIIQNYLQIIINKNKINCKN